MRAGPWTPWFALPPDYRRAGWRADLLAGLTLGIILVPQAMAYGLLAGVPPVYGLYAALLPLVVYALLGSSPHVSVGPTALASLLCLNGLDGVAAAGSPEYLGYAILLAGLTGALQLLFGLLRLGGLVSLLSRPVLSGFVSAAAVLIIASQLDALVGISAPRSSRLHETLWSLCHHLGSLDARSAALGVSCLVALLACARWAPRWPAMLTVLVVATGAVAAGGPFFGGVATVGEVPAGLPGLVLPAVTGEQLTALLPVAFVLALISFIETLSIGKTFASRHGYYRMWPNRELVALGLSKLVGVAWGAIPTSASFSRSAVVEEAGGRGPLSGLVAAGLLVLVLLFLTPLFYHLPIPALAAVIIFSVRRLFDWGEMRRLRELAPKELFTLLITLGFTLFAGLEYGITGGVLLSLGFVLLRAARPHLAELGRVPGTNAFRNLARFPDAVVDPELLIVRFDAELYFGNGEHFRERVLALAAERDERLRAVILDAHTIGDLDSSGLYELDELYRALGRRGVDLYLTGLIGPVRDMLFRGGLMERLGADRQFLSVQDAVTHFRQRGSGRDWGRPAVQHG